MITTPRIFIIATLLMCHPAQLSAQPGPPGAGERLGPPGAFGPPPWEAKAGPTQTLAGLSLEGAKFEEKSIDIRDQTIRYRAYEGLVYVSKPIDAPYQSLNLYIPVAYFEGGSIGGFNAKTAPIFLPNGVGGYMPSLPDSPGKNRRSGGMNSLATALAKGCVVASPGARGRTLKGSDGKFTGKAPAAIVDLKAAVRFLRHNDRFIPGDMGKIISNGTSAGGALSALLGASGNRPDYEPYLKLIGAAEERDDVFAASCYCPITNLDHADAAYEWLFQGLNDYKSRSGPGTMNAAQISASEKLKALFPAYLNDLGLHDAQGTPLELQPAGDGTFKDYVKSFVVQSAQKTLDAGADLSSLSWIKIENGKVVAIDFESYIRFAGRMKAAPAFDSLDASSGENDLFGSETVGSQHFTAFSKGFGSEAPLAAPAIVRLMNPLNFISAKSAGTASHWRIRHGAIDRDTSLAIPVILATKLQNAGFDVNFAVPWAQGHGGDYDLEELFAWVASICK